MAYYEPVEGEPYKYYTTASTFGGPDDAEDNGKFAFGGGSTTASGELNSEPYAAFPQPFYDSGAIKVGQRVKVVNPDNGKEAYVVARDIGPSAKSRGIDFSPNVMDQLGAETDKTKLIVDFSPNEQQSLADIGGQPDSGGSVEDDDSAFGPSGNTGSLSDIGSGEPVPVDPDQPGDSSPEATSEVVSVNPVDYSKIPAEVDDKGWVHFSNGVSVGPNGIREIKTPSGVIALGADGKKISFIKNESTKTLTPEELEARASSRAADASVLRTDYPDGPEGDKAYRHERKLALQKGGGAAVDPDAIADAIVSGDQPPDLKGLYRWGASIRTSLANRGYNLSDASMDWTATQKFVSSLNGPQQLKLRQAIDNVFHATDLVDDYAKQWDAGRWGPLNKVRLAAALAGLKDVSDADAKEAQRVAAGLDSSIQDITLEMANVYMGGNSPTDQSMQRAAHNLQGQWAKETLLAQTELLRRQLTIRDNSIKNTSVSGVSGSYLPDKAEPTPTPAAPVVNKKNIMYSPSTKTYWVDGVQTDKDGNPL